MIEKKADYLIELQLLMEQWKNSPNLIAIISAGLSRGNDMEDAIFEVRDLMDIDNGEGLTLDYIGKVWNAPRDGQSDANYKITLKQAKSQSFSGEPEAIIDVLKASYGGTFVRYSPEYPGKFRLVSDAFLSQATLDTISMAGVQAVLGGIIVDALGNNIIDALGNNILHVDSSP